MDCRHLRNLFESQKHEYYQSRSRQYYGDESYGHGGDKNVSIASTLVGSYLSKVDPGQESLSQIRYVFHLQHLMILLTSGPIFVLMLLMFLQNTKLNNKFGIFSSGPRQIITRLLELDYFWE